MEIRPTSFCEIAYLSTIRLLAAVAGGFEAASAFVVKDAQGKGFLVTTRHAVATAESVTLHFYGGDIGPNLGPSVPFEIRDPSAFWYLCRDDEIDVAVAPLEPITSFFDRQNQPFFVASIPCDSFAPTWRHLPPSPFDGLGRPRALDELLIVGYPNDYRDSATSLPLLRRGLMATPLWLDYEGRPAFLIDTAASHGTSGGPVFYSEEMHRTGSTMSLHSGGLVLLGIFSEVLPPKKLTAPAMAEIRPPHLGVAYKTTAILETLTAIGFSVEDERDTSAV